MKEPRIDKPALSAKQQSVQHKRSAGALGSTSHNTTGLPDNLKAGIENISGYSMNDVKVHYNSAKPATLQAHAYAQGTDIHLAPGQERHLPHEAWHVVQQKQGRVKPTQQLKSRIPVNDDTGLEKEADSMGRKALQNGGKSAVHETAIQRRAVGGTGNSGVVQRLVIRIRDVGEMMGFGKPTIMEASHDTKNSMYGSEKSKEDIGITKALKGRQLDNGEELRVVAHGSRPKAPWLLSKGTPTLGGFLPFDLAKKLSKLFPEKYRGIIYLDGCYTGLRLNFTPGTSFLELFVDALVQLRPDIEFQARGNLGAAATLKSGEEQMTLDEPEARIAQLAGWQVFEVEKDGKIEYKVISPYGIARYQSNGAYTDIGLSKAYKKEQKRKRREELERNREEDNRRHEAYSKMKPEDLQSFNPIWNDLL